mmetsp:Transcript_55742/g.130616  ORF Transcript_55742/g.130616 Transcript_55742/m.130616 type:complete len:216 (+) Transcript_55742:30-677(+)
MARGEGERQTSGSNVPHYGAAEPLSEDDRSSRAIMTAAVATFALTVLALLAVHGESSGGSQTSPHSMAMKTVAMARQMQTRSLEKSVDEIRRELGGGGGDLDGMWDRSEATATATAAPQPNPMPAVSPKTKKLSDLHQQAVAKQKEEKSAHKEVSEEAKLEKIRAAVNGNGALAGYSFGLGDAVATSDVTAPLENLPRTPHIARVDEMNDDLVKT